MRWPTNKWMVVGALSVIIGILRIAREAWLTAAILLLLGAVNFAIAFHEDRKEKAGDRPPAREVPESPEWKRNLLTGLIMFAGITVILLFLFGDLASAAVVGAVIMGPLTIFGVVSAYRRERTD